MKVQGRRAHVCIARQRLDAERFREMRFQPGDDAGDPAGVAVRLRDAREPRALFGAQQAVVQFLHGQGGQHARVLRGLEQSHQANRRIHHRVGRLAEKGPRPDGARAAAVYPAFNRSARLFSRRIEVEPKAQIRRIRRRLGHLGADRQIDREHQEARSVVLKTSLRSMTRFAPWAMKQTAGRCSACAISSLGFENLITDSPAIDVGQMPSSLAWRARRSASSSMRRPEREADGACCPVDASVSDVMGDGSRSGPAKRIQLAVRRHAVRAGHRRDAQVRFDCSHV